MATHVTLHTLVSFVIKPRRTRAVPRLSLLGEQGADVSRELTCNVLCVYPCYFLVRAGLYCKLYTISDTLLKVQIKWRHVAKWIHLIVYGCRIIETLFYFQFQRNADDYYCWQIMEY